MKDAAKSSPLSTAAQYILVALASEDLHGYGIIQDARERGEAVPDIGTLYRALARMVDQGLIEAGDRLPAQDASEERRNYYRITALGLKVAKAEARRMESLTRAARIGGLLNKEAR